MKDKYEDMLCDIVVLETADVIVTSGRVGTYDDVLPNGPSA